MRRCLSLICAATWLPSLALAQDHDEVVVETPQAAGKPDGFEDLDLDTLLSLEVSVASFRATTLRESPGIVTVVTRDEILASGARDLIDVLRMVPGFFFSVDVQGVIGLGIRGQWAHEGKILLIIDGHEINELGFQTLQLGHHYPVENIERVEIIRGPGSAIYGGNAELGVVKVITRSGDTLRGARASLKYGAPERFYSGNDKLGYGDLTLEAGSVAGDFEWSVSGFIGRSVRSDRDYTASDGTVLELGNSTVILPALVDASVAYGATRLRVMYDHYRLDSPDGFDIPTEFTYHYIHSGLYAELSSNIELLPGLRLIPKLSYRQQRPWYTPIPDDPDRRQELIDTALFFQQTYHRLLGNVSLSWDAFDTANIVLGVETFYDRAVVNQTDPEARATELYVDDDGNETSRLAFITGAVFGEFTWPNRFVNFTVGGRLEIHSEFGLAAVPRIALTKVFDFGLHAKLLAAQAFRMPGFQNKILEKTVDPDNEIKPERTTVFEAEVGYQIPSGPRFTANGFITTISNPVIYIYDDELGESYFNRGRSSTIGGEFEGRWVFGFGNVVAAYGYYQALGTPIEDYVVPGTKSLLGAPRHRLLARASFEVIDDLFVTPSISCAFDRWAILGEEDMPEKLKPEVILGAAIMYMNAGVEGFDVSLIAHDLLDNVELFPQAYRGGHSPWQGGGRQVMLRLSYEYGR